jgi:hypothetical protein
VAAFPEIYGKLMLGIAVTPGEIAMLGELAGLLGSANARKQAGFYTDFDPHSGSWSAPAAVSDAEFGKIRALVGQYVAETQRQTDDFHCCTFDLSWLTNLGSGLSRRCDVRVLGLQGPEVCTNPGP